MKRCLLCSDNNCNLACKSACVEVTRVGSFINYSSSLEIANSGSLSVGLEVLLMSQLR